MCWLGGWGWCIPGKEGLKERCCSIKTFPMWEEKEKLCLTVIKNLRMTVLWVHSCLAGSKAFVTSPDRLFWLVLKMTHNIINDYWPALSYKALRRASIMASCSPPTQANMTVSLWSTTTSPVADWITTPSPRVWRRSPSCPPNWQDHYTRSSWAPTWTQWR